MALEVSSRQVQSNKYIGNKANNATLLYKNTPEGRVNIILEIIDQEKDLGIITDNHLKFKEHISAVVY